MKPEIKQREEEHIPVLLEESTEGLNLKKNNIVIDATADGGGHASQMLKRLGKEGKLIALDLDPEMISRLQEKFRDDRRVKLFNLNFSQIGKLAESLKIRPDAIFFDLGLSSFQLVASGRGFSFQKDEPLLMTFSPEQRPTAAEIINSASEKELADIIYRLGEERNSRKIAKAIVVSRRQKRITGTKELKEIIERTLKRKGKIHPATKTFQALRIYVNDELKNIEEGLSDGFKILKKDGRLAAISFHSLEDRLVKKFFRDKTKNNLAWAVTKKPLRPSRDEIIKNPRSRSAKLRIIQKL